jgi:hypothetical protein
MIARAATGNRITNVVYMRVQDQRIFGSASRNASTPTLLTTVKN